HRHRSIGAGTANSRDCLKPIGGSWIDCNRGQRGQSLLSDTDQCLHCTKTALTERIICGKSLQIGHRRGGNWAEYLKAEISIFGITLCSFAVDDWAQVLVYWRSRQLIENSERFIPPWSALITDPPHEEWKRVSSYFTHCIPRILP